MQTVDPRVVAVSCGKDNDYGHPHGAALAAFASVGADVYRTDADGSIVCYADETGRLQVACGGKGRGTGRLMIQNATRMQAALFGNMARLRLPLPHFA